MPKGSKTLRKGHFVQIAALIEKLAAPAACAYPVTDVTVLQTHISAVFLAGNHVYKIKKPVQPGFLDFSTLEKRQFFCEEEVRLNRRLAPEVYLDVVPVTLEDGQPRFEGRGEPIEWAVKMVRLPDEATLHARLERGEGSVALAELVARRIAAFHRQAAVASQPADFDLVRRNLLDVLKPTQEQSDPKLDRIRQRTEALLAQQRPLIEKRALRGMTRDCHGDLHLDHVYYFPDRSPPGDLVIVDCIEFNERFRFIDPIADMAFAAMDFIYHGRRDLADAFCEAYYRESGDQEGRALLDLYICYRASVRAYVDSLKFLETEVPRGERRQAQKSAAAHALLALVQLEPPARRPCLLLVAGLPGTGKSTLARALAEKAEFEILRSDVVRKELAARQQYHANLYTEEWDARTYAACLEQAISLLHQGKRVIVDATFRREHHRGMFLQAGRRCCVPTGMILCLAEPSIIQARLRQRRHDASDADWTVYQMLAQAWEPLGPETAALVHRIDTGAEQEAQVISCAMAGLVESGMWNGSGAWDHATRK